MKGPSPIVVVAVGQDGTQTKKLVAAVVIVGRPLHEEFKESAGV